MSNMIREFHVSRRITDNASDWSPLHPQAPLENSPSSEARCFSTAFRAYRGLMQPTKFLDLINFERAAVSYKVHDGEHSTLF